MFVQAFLPEPPVEAFHLGIVGRRAWPTEVELHPMLVCSPVHGLRDELAAVVDLDGLGRATLDNNRVEHSHNVFPFEALADFDGQAFPGVVTRR